MPEMPRSRSARRDSANWEMCISVTCAGVCASGSLAPEVSAARSGAGMRRVLRWEGGVPGVLRVPSSRARGEAGTSRLSSRGRDGWIAGVGGRIGDVERSDAETSAEASEATRATDRRGVSVGPTTTGAVVDSETGTGEVGRDLALAATFLALVRSASRTRGTLSSMAWMSRIASAALERVSTGMSRLPVFPTGCDFFELRPETDSEPALLLVMGPSRARASSVRSCAFARAPPPIDTPRGARTTLATLRMGPESAAHSNLPVSRARRCSSAISRIWANGHM